MKNHNKLSIAEAATQKTLDRSIGMTLVQRVQVGGLIAQQTAAKVSKAIGHDANDDDMAALYSILRKIRATPAELVPFTRFFGGEKTLDVQQMIAQQETEVPLHARLDGFEARLLGQLLSGWLRNEGAIGDRDWATPVIEACK